MAVTYDALFRINAKATGAAEVRTLGAAISGLTKSAGGLGAVAGAVTGLGVAVGGLGLAAAGKGLVDMADSLDELAQRSGASVENLSKLGAAARMSGLDTEQVSGALVKLSKNLGEIAAGGGKDAKAALDQLGVSAFNATGELRKPDEVLFDMINRFSQLEDGGQKTRLAMELLGRSGASLIPVFNMGAEAIQGLNTGISTEFAKNAGIYNDRIETLKMQFTALGVTVLERVLPALIKGTEYVSALLSAGREWFAQNRDRIDSFGETLIAAGKKFLGLGAPVAAGIAAFKLFTSTIQTAQAALKGLILLQSMTPVGLLTATAGLSVGLLLTTKAGAAIAELTKRMREQGGDVKELDGVMRLFQEASAGALETTDQLAPSIANARQETDALRKLEQDRAYWLERAGSAYERQAQQIDLASVAQQRRVAIAGEENTLQQAYNNLGKTILQNRLALAKTDAEKLAISRQIAQVESESARLQLEATRLQIQAEQELKAAALNRAIATRRSIEATLALASSLYNAGQVGLEKVLSYRMELDKARAAADTAQAEFNQASRIAGIRQQVANVNYQASVLQATGGITAPTTQTPRNYVTVAGIRIPQFATGGYVTRPTLAMIGEGGEPEYVVPRSKVKSFAAAVSSGVSGEQAIASRRPSWREIALETLANDPNRYMSAAHAVMTGWRKSGMKWSGLEEPRKRREALRSLGFRVANSVDFGGGGVSIKGHPSLSNIRRELEALRNGRQRDGGGTGVTLNTRIDRVIRQDGEDRVTLAQAQALASDAARQAVAEMNRNLTRPSFRQSRGLRG
jgi:hypothetical protein